MPTFIAQIEAIPQVPQAFTLTWAEELRFSTALLPPLSGPAWKLQPRTAGINKHALRERSLFVVHYWSGSRVNRCSDVSHRVNEPTAPRTAHGESAGHGT